MKESLWAYLMLLLGVIVTTVILLVVRVTTHAEEDYYLAREIMQSALLDSVDYSAYRATGKIIISKDKFMEIYLRRFAESVTNSQDYLIDFYDIYEEPPKASVRIRTMSGEATVNNDTASFSVDTLITGILETNFEQYNEGKSITIRYVGDDGKGVTLVLPGTDYSSAEEENSAACSGGTCNAFYNGEKKSYSSGSLNVRNPKYIKSIDEFNTIMYKYCEYPEAKKSTSGTSSSLTRYVKSDGVKTYSDSSMKTGAQSIDKCTKVTITDTCDYGPAGNMCKTSDGRYIAESDLTFVACSSSSTSKKTTVTPEELENLKTLDEIKKELEKNKSVLIELDYTGATTYGDPASGFYYRLSDLKLYKKYNITNRTYEGEIETIKMPTKGSKTCVYKYNGSIVIDKNGNFDSSKIDTSLTKIKLTVEC